MPRCLADRLKKVKWDSELEGTFLPDKMLVPDVERNNTRRRSTDSIGAQFMNAAATHDPYLGRVPGVLCEFVSPCGLCSRPGFARRKQMPFRAR